jgi:hypothetical protein
VLEQLRDKRVKALVSKHSLGCGSTRRTIQWYVLSRANFLFPLVTFPAHG